MAIDNITDQPNANLWDSAGLGARELPSFANVETPTGEPTTSPSASYKPSGLERFGLALEAFGSGYRGEEPLFLKLRRQRMLEDQQQQETTLKLAQMKQTQNQHQFDEALKVMLSDAPAEVKESVFKELGSSGNAFAQKMSGVATKQVLSQLPGVMDYLDPELLSEVQKMRDDPNYSVKGGLGRIEADVKHAAKLRDSAVQAEGDQRRYDAYLAKADKVGGVEKLSDGEQAFILQHLQTREKRSLELSELRDKLKLTRSQVKVAEATEPAQIAQAGQAAAPKMRQYPVDQEGNVRVEQFDGTKWTVLAGKVKASPTTNISIGGEPKAMPPEQAARFSHFLEAREAAKQLPALVFDKSGNIKSENLLTGMFPMGGLPFTEGRTLNQVVERAIQAKLRAETGAAAPENEVKNIALRYKPSVSDSKSQIKGKLEAFTNYIEDAIWLADPTGMHQGRATSRKPMGDANKRGDALKKLHPDWTDYEVLARLNAEGY